MHHEWRAGMARTTFPIEPGTPLGGYIAREHPATGTLDPLQIDVLLLDDGAPFVMQGRPAFVNGGNQLSMKPSF